MTVTSRRSDEARPAAMLIPMIGWHVTARRNRTSITDTGLRRDGGGWDAGWVWFFTDRTVAETLASGVTWGGGDCGNDIWRIDLTGLDSLPDPHPGWGDARDDHARAVQCSISPDRLELVTQ